MNNVHVLSLIDAPLRAEVAQGSPELRRCFKMMETWLRAAGQVTSDEGTPKNVLLVAMHGVPPGHIGTVLSIAKRYGFSAAEVQAVTQRVRTEHHELLADFAAEQVDERAAQLQWAIDSKVVLS